MVELDAEILERVARWCAEAGRPTGPAEIRAALAPLGWDELLAVRALLADPPPARPLGPFALADLARGAPADVVAERDRAGRYRLEPEPEAAGSTAAKPRGGERVRGARAKAAPRPAEIVVRRARDRVPAPVGSAPPLPSVSALMEPGGRAILEQLVRRHGARRGHILAELATGWRADDGGPPREEHLTALLEEHGLSRAFERRERDELLHALRAAGGERARAAAAVGIAPENLDATLERLGARDEAERIREERRGELRGRATLTDRVHLFLEDATRLADLGLVPELEADLAARLPEHVRALRAGTEPIRSAFGRSLSLDAEAIASLEARFGLDLGPGSSGSSRSGPGEAGPARTPDRPRGERSRQQPRDRAGAPRTNAQRRERPGSATAERRHPGRPRVSGASRSDRPRGERPPRQPAERRGSAAPRSGDARSRSDRPSGSRRPAGSSPRGPRTNGTRPSPAGAPRRPRRGPGRDRRPR
ncbi:Fis family transcriptional regulator [Anaeromyxobacter oryzisoli]|uniref:Fis family transcriptional regulator n=1 Tax=Anaeromyxobacter oryzisoli TaxID=2925408 RepID=UPI001F5A4780|nr:Fis family transcriptional regulator [Anaeromyxobacter sp. SG63]